MAAVLASYRDSASCLSFESVRLVSRPINCFGKSLKFCKNGI